jgi:UDP-N-acetylmuramoylalanine-D-glutamate ligase
VTSIFPEHMDYHRNIRNYYSAKKNIFKYQEKEDFFVFNVKNKKIYSWLKDVKSKKVHFASIDGPNALETPLQGEHNRDNIRAAMATARILNIPDETINKAIRSFKGLSHRIEFVGEYYGVKFYDDAISTTPESTIFAIKSLPKIGTIFLGGQDRGYSFLKLENIIKKYKVKNIVLFPESGKRIFRKRKGLNILETSSMGEAVEFAYKYTNKGEICLLSCASPSYSLWKNFEDKGNQFQSAIKRNISPS